MWIPAFAGMTARDSAGG